MRGHNFAAKWSPTWGLGPYVNAQRSQKYIDTSGCNCLNDWGWKGDGQKDHTSHEPLALKQTADN